MTEEQIRSRLVDGGYDADDIEDILNLRADDMRLRGEDDALNEGDARD